MMRWKDALTSYPPNITGGWFSNPSFRSYPATVQLKHTVYPQDALYSGPGTYRRQVHLPRVRSDSFCLFLQTDAPYPHIIYPEKTRNTCLTVPQSVLMIILIVNISPLENGSKIISPNRASVRLAVAVFFHILMSFTDTAVLPKTRPPHLFASWMT